MTSQRKTKILIANPGLDVHDAGARYVSQILRDAGLEVIYIGIRQSAEGIVNAAIQEDVDIIGLSILSGRHDTVVPKIFELLREKGITEMKVLVGGIIPPDEIEGLKACGVSQVFLPGTSAREIQDYVKKLMTA
jgi:methylmalonyl-CoA mutase C-terminal domain/subunit